MNQISGGDLALPLEEYDTDEYVWHVEGSDQAVAGSEFDPYEGGDQAVAGSEFDPYEGSDQAVAGSEFGLHQGCDQEIAGSNFDPKMENGSQGYEAVRDLFVGSLGNASPVTYSGIGDPCDVICKICKQEVSSFVGKISCDCSMKSGLLWDGLPRWVCEKFKKNLGEKFAECGTIGHQDGVGVNVVREEPIVLEEELFFDVYEGRFGNAVCSLCNYATEEGLDICRTCVASTTYVNPENYEDWTEEEINRLDPFKEICVDKWLGEKGYSEDHLRSFCQRCSVEIIAGEYCVDCAHVLGLPGLLMICL